MLYFNKLGINLGNRFLEMFRMLSSPFAHL